MTNTIAILSLLLHADTTKVTVQYTAPVGAMVYFDAKHKSTDAWIPDYGVAVAKSGTNSVSFRTPWADSGFFRARTEVATPSSIPITGHWDELNRDQFRTDAALSRHCTYTISNNTTNTIYVMLVEIEGGGRTPLDYFPVLPGGTQQFGAPWNLGTETFSLDLFLRGYVGDKVRGIELRAN